MSGGMLRLAKNTYVFSYGVAEKNWKTFKVNFLGICNNNCEILIRNNYSERWIQEEKKLQRGSVVKKKDLSEMFFLSFFYSCI